ncbi:MAG: DNA repair protein RecN [Candidatus Xenobia bacterium]
MLEELEIFNFALVQEARLEFDGAFNVLTGETGAGKSIVLDALGFLLGGGLERGGGAGQTRVQGRFRVNSGPVRALLEQWGLDAGDELVLSRELGAGGRSVARINNRMSTVANLRELAEHLVDLHGQHQHYRLLRPSRHLELLDRSASAAHLERVESYARCQARVQHLAAELEARRQAEREKNRELEWIEHELTEIEQARPAADEEEVLLAEARRLASASELAAGTAQVAGLLGQSGLDRAERQLRALLRHDPTLEPMVTRLGEAASLLQETSHELAVYCDELGSNPARLEEVEARLDLLRGLKRKYGANLSEVLEYAGRARQRRQELLQHEARGHELEAELDQLRQQRDELAGQLTLERRRAARKLSREVEVELKGLGLEGTRFEVRLEALEQPGPTGLERGEFMLAPNPGVEPLPLARIASGGELSRLMLALVAVFSRFEPVPTLVFDEVDAGLGGRAAEAVSGKLRELSQRCQVLSVTHLAVLAAAASRHFRLAKRVQKNQTRIGVERLEGELREGELARMLSGDASPETARRHARELLGSVA